MKNSFILTQNIVIFLGLYKTSCDYDKELRELTVCIMLFNFKIKIKRKKKKKKDHASYNQFQVYVPKNYQNIHLLQQVKASVNVPYMPSILLGGYCVSFFSITDLENVNLKKLYNNLLTFKLIIFNLKLIF